jgi:hypothetical protein
LGFFFLFSTSTPAGHRVEGRDAAPWKRWEYISSVMLMLPFPSCCWMYWDSPLLAIRRRERSSLVRLKELSAWLLLIAERSRFRPTSSGQLARYDIGRRHRRCIRRSLLADVGWKAVHLLSLARGSRRIDCRLSLHSEPSISVGHTSPLGIDNSIRELGLACAQGGERDMDVCRCLLDTDDLVWRLRVLGGESSASERKIELSG